MDRSVAGFVGLGGGRGVNTGAVWIVGVAGVMMVV